MRFFASASTLLLFSSLATSLSVPTTSNALFRRKAESESELVDRSLAERYDGWELSLNQLEKRRGGGGTR